MVIKGSARGGAADLAVHLQRIDTNERAELIELRGVSAADLDGALREMEAVASGARSRRPFYHASINTPIAERLTTEQRDMAIDRLAAELGLTGQPRAVMEHVKAGRSHIHVAWSRIDGETLKAIPDSHNYRKHEIVARELEREFGHARVQGAHHEREGVERPKRTPTPEQMQQAARTGITPEEAKAELITLWNSADTGRAFAAALQASGWSLAQGDKRAVLVALDPAGGTHAINKAVTGLTAANVRHRLADIDASALLSVEEARKEQQQRLRDTLAAERIETRQPESEQAASPRQEEPTALIPAESPQKPESHEAAQAAAELPPEQPEATQSLPQEPSRPEDPAAAKADRSREPGLLRQVLDRMRARLEVLGGRLEAAFDRFKELIDQRQLVKEGREGAKPFPAETAKAPPLVAEVVPQPKPQPLFAEQARPPAPPHDPAKPEEARPRRRPMQNASEEHVEKERQRIRDELAQARQALRDNLPNTPTRGGRGRGGPGD